MHHLKSLFSSSKLSLIFCQRRSVIKLTASYSLSSNKNWIHSDKEEISNLEFYNSVNELANIDKDQIPFAILDVRNDWENKLADIPKTNKNGIIINKLNVPMEDILSNSDIDNIPKDKYIVCICHVGIRSGYVASYLNNKGYKAINLTGGINKLSEIWTFIPKY